MQTRIFNGDGKQGTRLIKQINYMACEISIPVAASATELFAKVKDAIEKNGGTINGDEFSGSFQIKIMGTIAGSYSTNGNMMSIIVENKPLFISCGQIESFLLSRLGS